VRWHIQGERSVQTMEQCATCVRKRGEIEGALEERESE
jgi:hypothetical protein